jgi:uncharacterized coiled-coil DUF342 family protein
MSNKEAYQQQLEAKLEEWQAEIDKLRAKAKGAAADSQVEYNQQIDALQSKQDEATQKLAELQEAGEGAWEQLKTGAEKAWNDLGEAVNAAKSKFR